MDIFGATYIDKIIYEECPYQINEYRRYRDDISSETTIAHQEVINDWFNNNIYKDKIKFKMQCDSVTIPFLDVRVNLIDGYLLTDTYSKRIDIRQYLNPTSCHPGHILRLFLKH